MEAAAMDDSANKKTDRDNSVDESVNWLNNQLSSLVVEEGVADDWRQSQIIFVVGTQRSGTTLAMQLLANTLCLTYPDNIVARLWGAPHAGVAISQSLKQ
jgi:hypothetical protein